MSNYRFTVFFVLLACGSVISLGNGNAGEKKITRKEVPDAVLKAFEKTYQKATIEGYTRDDEGGKTYYEIESRDGQTRRYLLFLADGTVVEVEEVVSEQNLPDPVRATIQKEYPTGSISKAEKITRNNVVEYGINITSGEKTHEIVVDPNGTIMKQKEKNKAEENEENEGEEDDDD